MNCNCYDSPARGTHTSTEISQTLVVPCDPKTLAGLQEEHLPHAPKAESPEPSAAVTARQLCRHSRIKLSPAAQSLLDDDISSQAFFERLLAHDHLAEARRVLAHAMPKRRALWWACLCAQDAYRNDLPPQVALAVETVVRFVHDSSEANRRETERIGRSFPSSRLEACLAMAAFFSGGNISLPHLPTVAPRPFVTGRLVGVSVYLASVARSAARYKDHLRQYLSLGVGIARGENLWDVCDIEPVRLDPCGASPLRGAHLGKAATRRSNRSPESVGDATR